MKFIFNLHAQRNMEIQTINPNCFFTSSVVATRLGGLADTTLSGASRSFYPALPRGSIYKVMESRTRRLIHGLVKLMAFYVSFIALWSQYGSFRTPQSCQFLNQSLFQSLPLVMDLG